MCFPAKSCWLPTRARKLLKAGDCAGFKAGDPNGHHLQNRGTIEALVLEIGTRNEGDSSPYSDIDMMVPPDGKPVLYVHKDGTPYTDIKRRGPDDRPDFTAFLGPSRPCPAGSGCDRFPPVRH